METNTPKEAKHIYNLFKFIWHSWHLICMTRNSLFETAMVWLKYPVLKPTLLFYLHEPRHDKTNKVSVRPA